MTRPARLAWSLFAVSIILLAVQTYYVLASGTPLRSDEEGLNSFPLITLGTALSAAVGALIASRHPGNRVGWLFCVGPLGTAAGLAAEAFATAVQLHGLAGPAWLIEPALVASYSLGAVWALTLVSAVFLVVPDGRLPSRRWRPVAAALPVPFLLATVTLISYASTHVLHVNQDESGVAWFYLVPLFAVWIILALTLAATTTCLVLRLRRSRGVLHQQLRWIATAASTLLIGTLIEIIGPQLAGEPSWGWALTLPLYLAYMSVPVAVAIAVLRYRLYDIDVVISRAALLALLLTFVVTGYVVAVVSLSGLLGDRVDAAFWPSLLATAVVALAFQPLRSRAVRFADRLAYGRRAVPYEALAEFSRRLGESPDPATLLPAVADTAAHAVNARRVTVALLVSGCPDQVATWPAAGSRDRATLSLVLPITDQGEQLGHLSVTMPPGRTLRPRDTDLLNAITDQAAIAFRNTRLTAELSARVEQLRAHTRDLIESRRRLITAGDAERRRLERAIARDVVPHLEPLPRALDALAGSCPADPTALHVPLGAATTALESLREITRGVFPAQLVRGGLAPALTSYLGRADSRGQLDLHESATDRRFDPRVEAAAYFCVAEAAQALDIPLRVDLTAPDEHLELRVRGRRRAPLAMSNIRDRVEAAGGTVTQENADHQTELLVRLPATSTSPRADGQVTGDQVTGDQGVSDQGVSDQGVSDQGVEVSQAAVSRSGPNADLVT